MAIKLVKTEEDVQVESMNMLIYGDPGTGKTTFAYSAKNPVLIALDKGYKRSGLRRDALEVEDWNDVLEVINTQDLINAYDTFIFDDMGSMQDFIKRHISAQGGATTKDGNLSMRGWGQLAQEFKKFFKKAKDINKDLILIAHSKEYKDGEDGPIMYKPDIQGSTYNYIFRYLDLVGYLHIKDGNREVIYGNNDRLVTKDCAEIGAYMIPDFILGGAEVEDKKLSSLMENAKKKVSGGSHEKKKLIELIKSIMVQINEATEPDQFQAILTDINENENANNIKRQIAETLKGRLEETGVKFNKETKEFSK